MKLPILNQRGQPELPKGRGPFAGNVSLVTLGCAKNLVDSEVMLGSLMQRGYRPVENPENADLIVVNTCGFLQSAVQEGVEKILELSDFRTDGRCKQLVVAGCMVERYREELVTELPEVDRFISVDEILSVGTDEATSADCLDKARRPYFLYDETMPRVLSTGSHSAFIKIAEGCNRPCAFCIIPKLRGSLRSRQIESVVQEFETLAANGVREFNLVAQDLTAYGTDFPQNRGIKSELPTLLKALDERAPTDTWIRLFYAYPVGTTDELLEQIIGSSSICNYFDIPLQHIASPVLKRMRRPLGAKGTRRLVEHTRATYPELHLRTTFIVGFPGETEEDVAELEAFIAAGHFTHVGVFTYSQEEEADSYSYSEQSDDSVKEERKARLMQAQQAVVAKRLESLVGSTQRVLVDGFHQETDLLLSARCAWQGPETDGEVLINELPESVAAESFRGTFVDVQIEATAGYDLVASFAESKRSS